MDGADWILVLHIVAVAAWLGADFTLAFASPKVSRAEAPVRAWWAATQGSLVRIYYNVAGVVVLATGVGLVLSDRAEWSSGFVTLGLVAVIVGALLGIFVFGPGTRRLVRAIDEGDAAVEKSVTNRLAGAGVVDSLIVIVTIAAMVGHWGA